MCNFLVPVAWYFKNCNSLLRSNKRHPPTSPNICACHEQNSHDSSSSHMIHHLQCAEQQYSTPKITNYCLTLCYHLTLLLIDSTLQFFSLRSRSYTGSFSTKLPYREGYDFYKAHNFLLFLRSFREFSNTSQYAAPAMTFGIF